MNSRNGRVIVGYDGTPDSCSALDWAATHAEWQGMPLTVLNVVDYLGQLPCTLPTVPVPQRNQDPSGRRRAPLADADRPGGERTISIDIAAFTHTSRVASSLIQYSQ